MNILGDYKDLKYPIIQGGMAVRVSTASLAGAVAASGGVGIIGATGMDEDELKQEIRLARKLARSGLVGVNVMYAAKNFKRLVETALWEKVDLVIFGAGFSREIFAWGREAGVPIVSIVSSARLARVAEKCGAAAVIAEGVEAGGHLGTDSSLTEIVPEIKHTVNIPVIAAGGLTDADDIRTIMKSGADGVQLATRFVLSEECSVDYAFKKSYIDAEKNDIVIIDSPVGLPGRAIRNKFTDNLGRGKTQISECKNCLKTCSREFCILQALENSRRGMVEQGLIFSGQNVYKIKDILPVRVIIENLAKAFTSSV